MKKQRQEPGDDAVEEKEKSSTPNSALNNANGSAEGSEEEEGEKPTTFADRLRAGSNTLDAREGSEEDDRPVATEREGRWKFRFLRIKPN